MRTNQVNWDLYTEEDYLCRLDNINALECDGLIADLDSAEIRQSLNQFTVPIVGVGSQSFEQSQIGEIQHVVSDNASLIELAFQHLLDKHINRIAFYGIPETKGNGWAQERHQATEALALKHGVSFQSHIGQPILAKTWQQTADRLKDWLLRLPKPIGIVAVNDARARHLLQACDHLGILVPEEVSIIGIDDDDVARHLSRTSLSSVMQGSEKIGFMAAKQLHQLLENKNSNKFEAHLIAPEGIAERQSSDYLGLTDPHVMKAVNFVRLNATKGIKVEQVVDHVGVSRSTLDQRIKDALGYSLHTELHMTKLNKAAELLTDTTLAMHMVATMSGYPSVQYLYAVFQKHFETTPIVYRENTRKNKVDDEFNATFTNTTQKTTS
nr:substrate-binding domain-containing protein [Algibacillus agarilyticus]